MLTNAQLFSRRVERFAVFRELEVYQYIHNNFREN